MQAVIRQNKNINPLLDELDRFYSVTSEKTYKVGLIQFTFDTVFKELQELFNSYTDSVYDFSFVNKSYERVKCPNGSSKNIILCFSGGKDSIAAALNYKNRGYNVYLYHMKHINAALNDEWKICQEIADYMHLPLFIDTIKVSGHHDWVEHPMKNMIIANGALSYGVRENIGTKIAFGNYYTSSVKYDNFEFCGGDDMETWRVYEHIIQKIIPNFRIYVYLKNLGTTLNTICKYLELLNMSVSCIGRASMRTYWHDWVKKKYGIEIPKNRCGRCYKCQVEYVYMADHGLQKYNEEYYKYCMRGLKRNVKRELDSKYIGWYEVWNSYFFYPMDKAYVKEVLTTL